MQSQASLRPAQRRIYARQLLLREIGEPGQLALCATRAVLTTNADPDAASVARDYLTRAGLPAIVPDGVTTATGGPDGAGASVASADRVERNASADAAQCCPVKTLDRAEVDALAGARELRAAASALAGAFAAVEAIKAVLRVGEPAMLPAQLRLGGRTS